MDRRSVDQELTAQVAAAAPFAGYLGIEIVSASPHEVRARLAWSEDKCTTGGVLHGGALMGLADTLGGFCAFLNLPTPTRAEPRRSSRRRTSSAADPRRLRHAVRASAAHGQPTIVVDTELYDDGGRLVARVTQTQAVL